MLHRLCTKKRACSKTTTWWPTNIEEHTSNKRTLCIITCRISTTLILVELKITTILVRMLRAVTTAGHWITSLLDRTGHEDGRADMSEIQELTWAPWLYRLLRGKRKDKMLRTRKMKIWEVCSINGGTLILWGRFLLFFLCCWPLFTMNLIYIIMNQMLKHGE